MDKALLLNLTEHEVLTALAVGTKYDSRTKIFRIDISRGWVFIVAIFNSSHISNRPVPESLVILRRLLYEAT